jgi:hypothetical protein
MAVAVAGEMESTVETVEGVLSLGKGRLTDTLVMV